MDDDTLIGVPTALTYKRDFQGRELGPILTLSRVDVGSRGYDIKVPITLEAMNEIQRDALTLEGAFDLADARRTAVNDDHEIDLNVQLDAKAPIKVTTDFADRPASRANRVPTDDPRVNGDAIRAFFPNAPIHTPPDSTSASPSVALNRSWFDRFRRRVTSPGPRL